MKVAVGSKNPAKVEAVTNAFKKVFGECEVLGVFVPSGVPDMPMSLDELFQGAKNRAGAALMSLSADFGVGLEGGFEDTKQGVFLTSFVVVVSKEGILGYSRSGGLLMPERIVKEVHKGKELEEVMDEIMGEKNVGEKQGAIGFFTNNLITRSSWLENTTIHALTRFIKKEMFGN
jgi:inosine/xanthosine triphosphatase